VSTDEPDPGGGPPAGPPASDPAPSSAPAVGGLGPGAESELNGHVVRRYLMGVSGAALALAWARQEDAPHGATVVVDREVSPLGRLGRMWNTPPESTLSVALVLRPPLPVDQADATWLLAGLAAAEGAAAASGKELSTWWPDRVVDSSSGEELAAVKVEVQLGPGKVRSAVASLRMDLDKLGLGADGREQLLEAVLAAVDNHSAGLDEGSEGVAAAYEGQCWTIGRRVKLRLLPKGETRGVARRIDRSARLELESTTGLVQRVAIDALREIEVV
jgi:BirA family biotin operon repressor/biotin-[acetyl-CoA-carboxylase] ligase